MVFVAPCRAWGSSAPVCGLFRGLQEITWPPGVRRPALRHTHAQPPVLMSLTLCVHAGRPSDGDGQAHARECRKSVNQSPRWPAPRRGLHTLLSPFTNTRTHTHTRTLNSTASVWTLRRGEAWWLGAKQKCVSVPLSAGEQRIPLKKAWRLRKPGLALTRLNPAEKEWLFQSTRFVFLPAP